MTTITKKNITIDDVRQALAGDSKSEPISPFNTNAHSIREILGRGSFGTIQKHLATIRNETTQLSNGTEQSHPEMPKPPEGIIADLWKAACLSAQTTLLERCDSLNSDRDSLREALSLSATDYNTALQEIGSLESIVEQKDADLTELKNKASAVANEIATLKAKLNESHELNNKLTALIERSLGASEDKPERKQRTKITDEVVSEVLKMIDAGETAGDIAGEVGISIGSVNKIKKEHKES